MRYQSAGQNVLKVNNAMTFGTTSNRVLIFLFYFSLRFFGKLLTPPQKYTFTSVIQYYRHFSQTEAFHLTYTTEIYIEKILKNTNIRNAAGTDEPPVRFLRDGLQVLLKPISDLCNLSIKLGSFPDSGKIAKLKPLFKKGPKTKLSNNGPIPLLPFISKIIEKIIHEKTSSVLSNNEILYNYQSGFRKINSTES